MRIRVLLVDDQAVVRAGFRVMLDLASDLDAVGKAANGRDAIERARAARPDVVLMDVRMPGMDGIEATGQITTDPALASGRVLVLTTFEIDEYVFGALRAGASGFLLKDIVGERFGIGRVPLIEVGEQLVEIAPTTNR